MQTKSDKIDDCGPRQKISNCIEDRGKIPRQKIESNEGTLRQKNVTLVKKLKIFFSRGLILFHKLTCQIIVFL